MAEIYDSPAAMFETRKRSVSRDFPRALQGDWWRRECLAGRAFTKLVSANQLAGLIAEVELWNPPDSGVVVDLFTVFNGWTNLDFVAGGFVVRAALINLYTTLTRGHGENVLATGPNSKAEGRFGYDGAFPTTLNPSLNIRFQMPLRATALISLPAAPVVLMPGYGLLIANFTLDATTNCTFFWAERLLTANVEDII